MLSIEYQYSWNLIPIVDFGELKLHACDKFESLVGLTIFDTKQSSTSLYLQFIQSMAQNDERNIKEKHIFNGKLIIHHAIFIG